MISCVLFYVRLISRNNLWYTAESSVEKTVSVQTNSTILLLLIVVNIIPFTKMLVFYLDFSTLYKLDKNKCVFFLRYRPGSIHWQSSEEKLKHSCFAFWAASHSVMMGWKWTATLVSTQKPIVHGSQTHVTYESIFNLLSRDFYSSGKHLSIYLSVSPL